MRAVFSKSSWLGAGILILGLALSRAQTTATWIGPTAGGEWNTGANWDAGLAPADATTNAFIAVGNTVSYNFPMTAVNFGVLTNIGILNINTNGFNNSAITLTNTGARLFVNAGGAVNTTNISLFSNGAISVGPGGSLTLGGTLTFGGSVTATALGSVTNTGGFLSVNGVAMNPNNGSIGTSCRLLILGGSNYLGNYSAQRSPGGNSAPPALGTDGLVVSNGLVNAASLSVGNNAHGIIFQTGGIITNSGSFIIKNATGTRPARFVQLGGLFVMPGTNTVIMQSTADTVYSVLGGTNIIGGIQFNATTILFTNAGAMYLGSGGIVSNGTAAVTALLNTGGKFGASADWTNTTPITLNGGSFDAEDVAGVSHNIYSSGILRGLGALTKTGPGALTLGASNTFSGATIVSGGTLALVPDVSGSTGSIASASIIIGSGTTFDVSQVAGYTVNPLQTLSGSGVVTGAVNVAATGIVNPGSNALTGTLTFTNDLIQTGGAVNHFDVPGDFVNIAGALTVSGTNTIEINGSIPAGTPYALFRYGSLNGGLTNFAVTGATGTLSNNIASRIIYLVVSSSLRGPTNVTWIGNSIANNWDVANATNWLDGGVGSPDFFISTDNARFDNLGGAFPLVNIPGPVSPGSVIVDSTSNYVFSGTGSISGSANLTKTNSGVLSIVNTNNYTGITTLGGGVLEVSTITASATASPLGSATADPSFLVFNGGTLRYSGATTSSDRGATFAGTGTIDVTNPASNLTISGTLVGAAGLTKVGAGTLILSGANTYAGATTLSNGTVQVTTSATAVPSAIVFAGGTLNLNVANQTLYNNPLVITNTGTLIGTGGNNNVIQGPWSGNGTLNVNIASGTFSINANMTTNFTGTILVTDNSTASFRFNAGGTSTGAQQSTGSPTATFDLGNSTVSLINRNGGGDTFGQYDLGAFAGGPNTFLRGSGSSGSSTSTYRIGAKNLNTTFAGTIATGTGGSGAFVNIVKLGTGTFTLTGNSTYTGYTSVSNGVLALAFNGSSDGSISSTTNIFINTGAILDVSGRSDGTLQLGSSQSFTGSGTVRGSVNAASVNIIAPGPGIGTLTVTNTFTLGGTVNMELNRSSSPNSDRLVATNIILGGTLVVNNTGPALKLGDTFTLFSGALSGSFNGNVTLPANYTFDVSQLETTGKITVTGVPPPFVISVQRSAGSLTFSGSGGTPGAAYTILTTTNLALPKTNWTVAPNGTGTFDGNGTITPPATITVDPTTPLSFYILSQ